MSVDETVGQGFEITMFGLLKVGVEGEDLITEFAGFFL